MGDKDGAQHVFALKREGGAVLWKVRVGPPLVDSRGGARTTPVVDGERVYALGTSGDLVCLDAATGKVVWSKNLERDYGGRMMSGWMWSESPLVDGDRLVFTPGARDAALVAVDKATGRDVWRAAIPDLGPAGKDGAGYSSIVVSNGAGVKQYVQLLGRGLVGIRASDGKHLWGYNRVANGVANISTPLVRANWVFASTGYQTGSVLLELQPSGDGVAARELYFLDSKTLQNHHGGLVLVGNHVYAGHGHNKGFPICVDFITGKVAWGGDIRNAGTRLRGGDVRRRAAVLPLRERGRRAGRGEPERLRREGLVHDPGGEGPELGPPLDRRRPALRARAGQPLLLRHPAGEVGLVGEELIPR